MHGHNYSRVACLVSSILFAICVLAVKGATIVWINPNGGNWSVPANWNLNAVPGPGDTALIGVAGTYTVTQNVSATISGLVVGADATGIQTLSQASAVTLTLNGSGVIHTNGRHNLAAGTFAGTGSMTVEGVMTWSGGAIASGVAVTVASEGALNVTGTTLKTLNGAVTNAGMMRWSGSGTSANWRITGRVHNLTDAVFEIQNDQFVDYYTDTPEFINEGIIRKTGGVGTTTWEIPLHNSGTIETLSGVMGFGSGSTFRSGTQFLGAGINRCNSGAITFIGDIFSENLELSGATISGTNTFSGTVQWLSGILAGNSAATVAPSGTLLIGGTALKTLDGVLTNAGTMRWSGTGDLRITGRAHNLAGALVEIQNDRLVDYYALTPVFINEGIIRKTGGTGTTTWQIPVHNTGTIETASGVMVFGAGSIFRSGTQLLGAGINRCNNGAISFTGDIFSENLELSGATISGTNTFLGTVRWLGGALSTTNATTVAPTGTLLMFGPALKTLNGVLTNAGTVRWSGSGSTANFRITGRAHNQAGALFEIQNDQVVDYYTDTPQFINEGMIRKTIGASTNATTWQIPLHNTGTIEILSGVMVFGSGSTFGPGTQFLGAGINRCNGGAIRFTGDIFSENLELSGAVVSGTNTFLGTVRWLSGTLGGNSAATVAPTGTLLMFGPALKTLNGVLTNAGTVRWSGSGSTANFRITGRAHNLAGALFEIQNDQVVDYYTDTPQFINEGIIRKSVATGATTWQIPLINNAVIEVLSGTMSLADGSVFNTGTRFVGAGLTTLPSGTITLNGDIYSENLQLNGATVNGSGSFSGSLDWLSGTLQGSLNLNIPATGVLRLRSTGLKTINGSVTNAGTILWEGTGDLRLVGSIHNLPTGLFEARNNELVDYYTGTPEFVNEGVFRKTNSVGTTTFQVRILNSGIVDTASGTVIVAQGSVFHSGTRFLGSGVTVLNSGTITLNGDIFSENLQLNGATVTGAGSFTGSLDWLSGTLQAALDLTIPTNGTLRLRSTGLKTINGAVTNSGNIRWEGTGDLRLVGVLHNLPTGVFEARNDELIDFYLGTPVLINEGVFRKAAGTNITTSQIVFRNIGGVIEVNSGTVSLTSGMTNVAGHVALGGGRLQLPASATFRVNGGSLSGYGTMLAHVFNDNLVSAAGSNGVLTISGNYTQAVTGTLSVGLGGLDAGTNHSWMRVTGRASLDGTLDVALAEDFLPAISNTFQIATWTVNSGMFKCYNGLLLLGDARRLVPEYHAGNITLTTVEATEPQALRLGAHSLPNDQVLICWPSEFLGYTLQSTTNLTSAEWINITNTPRVFLDTEGVEKYFRTIAP